MSSGRSGHSRPGRLVLDASAALHAALPGPGAERVLDALASAAVVLVPDLYFAEVANALWKYVRAGKLDVEGAVVRLERSAALADRVTPSSELAKEALVAAVESGHPVYDCLYAVLARREGARVLTADHRFADALRAMRSPVVEVSAGRPPAESGRSRGSREGARRRRAKKTPPRGSKER